MLSSREGRLTYTLGVSPGTCEPEHQGPNGDGREMHGSRGLQGPKASVWMRSRQTKLARSE